jgi:MoaA/NifB/PqqE/SkfB family radical SAM enzyme
MKNRLEFNLESFCSEPWSQIEIDAQGDFKICCLANFDKDFGMAINSDGRVMNATTDSIKDAINSETHKAHRLALSRNEQPLRCRSCYDSERASKSYVSRDGATNTISLGISKRKRVLNRTTKEIPEYTTVETASDRTDFDGSLPNPKIRNLDIRFGNYCNFKCLMCSPQHSNQWYEDWFAITKQTDMAKQIKGNGEQGEIILRRNKEGKIEAPGMKRWWESPKWLESFEEVAPDLRYIYFTGGEPLIVPQMHKFLDVLIERGYSENITLRYDTNLSLINQKVIDKWKRFKKIYLCISMDDTHERYELIRFPGKFETIKNNILTVKQNNIRIEYVSACIGIASPYTVKRLSDFGEQYNVPIMIRFLEGPRWLDIRNYSKAAKLKIIDELTGYSEYHDYLKWGTAQIKLLENYLDIDWNGDIWLKDFIEKMNILDKQRGTNWKKTLPDVVELLRMR